jgi:uncharacterized protein (DUF362 family)
MPKREPGDRTWGSLSRRRFLHASASLGASAALGPLVLELAGCAADANSNDASAANGGGGAGGAASGGGGASGAASGGGGGNGGSAVGQPGGDGGSPVAGQGGGSAGTGHASDGGTNTAPDAQAAGQAIAAQAVLFGLYAGDGEHALRMAAQKLDFSWLAPGDSVLIKVASNSGNVHPATTSVAGVRGMVAELKARGAGRVVVADQAGVEWVRLSAAGRFSSTRERWQSNGLGVLESVAELHFFDDQGFDTGYVKATLPDGHHWPRGMWIAKLVTAVDHIIYMPRIGQHTLAGLTLAQKSAIGFLRDDSRHDLHNDAKDFYAKYADVSYVQEIRQRFRMAVSVAEKVLLHGGPDDGTIYTCNPPMVVASQSLANHDALAASILVTLDKIAPDAPAGMVYNAAFAPLANSAFAGGTAVGTGAAGAWTSSAPASSYVAHTFEQGITHDAATQRGWQLTGGQPKSIRIALDGAAPEAKLRSGIESHGEGLYVFG